MASWGRAAMAYAAGPKTTSMAVASTCDWPRKHFGMQRIDGGIVIRKR
jgi:hypothetical protein